MIQQFQTWFLATSGFWSWLPELKYGLPAFCFESVSVHDSLRSFQAPGRFGTCHHFRYLHIRSLELPTTCQVTWGIEILGPSQLPLIGSDQVGSPPKKVALRSGRLGATQSSRNRELDCYSNPFQYQARAWEEPWPSVSNKAIPGLIGVVTWTDDSCICSQFAPNNYYTVCTIRDLPQTGYLGGSAASPRLQQSRVQVQASDHTRESLEQPRPNDTRTLKMGKGWGLLADQNVQHGLVALWCKPEWIPVVVGSTAIRRRASAKNTGSCGSICFNNVQYMWPGWNLPRIHAHLSCLLLDALLSLLGPNRSLTQERNTKYGKYAGSLFTVPMVPEFNINPQHCQILPVSIGNHLPETYSQGSSRQILTSTSATVQLSPADEMPLNPVSPGYQRLSAQLPSSRFLQ